MNEKCYLDATVLPWNGVAESQIFLYNLKVLNIVRFIITNEKVNKICKYTFVTYEVKV